MVRFREHQRLECITNYFHPQIFLLLLLLALIILVFLLLFVFLRLCRFAVFCQVSVLLLGGGSSGALPPEPARKDAFRLFLQIQVALLDLWQA